MINLETLFENHFDNIFISDNNLQKFAEIHLQRLMANNPGGVFTQIISDSAPTYADFVNAISDEDTHFAVQQGLTITVKTLLQQTKEFISKSEGTIRGTFGKKSAEYQAFFPQKMDEYWQANLSNAELLLERFKTNADFYSAQLGTSIRDAAQLLLNDFKTKRESQLKKKGEVKDKKSKSRTARTALELQLMKNLHFIAYTFPGDVNLGSNYFDQSFIHRKYKKKKTE